MGKINFEMIWLLEEAGREEGGGKEEEEAWPGRLASLPIGGVCVYIGYQFV